MGEFGFSGNKVSGYFAKVTVKQRNRVYRKNY
jgi:hypothetical protein